MIRAPAPSLISSAATAVTPPVGRWGWACSSAYRRLDEGRAAGTITTTAQVDAAYAAVTLPAAAQTA